MPSCLGLYIENNLIKYAKVSKEKDSVKVEAFGIKFYDQINEAIEQIIKETFSYKSAISINLSEEMYNYFNLFSMLNKKDLKKVVQTEFEFLCEEKGYNVNALESRYILINNIENKENIKAIHISVNKTELVKRSQQLDRYRLNAVSPLPLCIPNLLEIGPKDNAIIVNGEDKTRITTILNGKIYQIDTLQEGMGDILTEINMKENSFAKAYEICKNTTIYTSEELAIQDEKNEYLEYIMPTLYKIVTQTKKIMESNIITIDKIYITGTMAIINNIDLYFEQYFGGTTCEILKPYFLSTIATNINVKDYIEVNSAIALALQGLGEGEKEINFKEPSFWDNLVKGMGEKGDKKPKKKVNINLSLKGALDSIEKGLLRSAVGLAFIIIIYTVLSIALSNSINAKEREAKQRLQETNSEIQKIESDITKVKEITNEYQQLKQNLDDLNAKIEEKYKTRNSIPNLLVKIMSVIPEGVQLTSIENTTDKHIVIKAQALRYEQLGFFKTKLTQEDILLNIQSDSGIMQDNLIKVTIEGDLP